jgi:hypothetical protein
LPGGRVDQRWQKEEQDQIRIEVDARHAREEAKQETAEEEQNRGRDLEVLGEG